MENKLHLQPRLQMLASLVPLGARLVDVGTDHGYLPVWLLQQERIVSAIATDIHREPLLHAVHTAREGGVEERIDFRLCDGLWEISPQEADTVVIAGMGGETIAAILSAASWTRQKDKTLLLQPMTKAEDLRVWLIDKGYSFTGEHLVWDKNFLYPIFCVCGGTAKPLTPEEVYGGILLEGDPLYGDYLDQQCKRLRRRIDGLRRSDREENRRQAEVLEGIYLALKKKRGAWSCIG